MAVAELQSERRVQVEAGVHAGDHGHLEDRARVHPRVLEFCGVALVRFDETISDGATGACGVGGRLVRRSRHAKKVTVTGRTGSV
ncbi:hypothetical protein GCM10010271_65390 [Streptomyces kurssanovii]|nr:hypothetical protein GCM10010271_65390 [Streptomyces kurssanovii]